MKIDSFSFGRITINGTLYHRDVILFPDSIITNWRRNQGHVLSLDDLQDVLRFKPEVLVVGTGAYGSMKIPSSTRKGLEEKGIELFESTTDQAWKLFNQYREEGKKVSAAFHLTC